MVYQPKKDAEDEGEGEGEGEEAGSDGDDEDVGDTVDLKQAHLQQGDVAYSCGNMQLAFT